MTLNEIIMSLEIGLIYSIVGIGIYLTFRVIDFPDLTCDGSFVLGAALSSIALKMGCNPLLALLFAFLGGGGSGFVTGLLNKWLRITELLSGILVAFMLYSINLKVMRGPNITLIDEVTVFNYFNPLFVLLIISTFLWVAFSYLLTTDFGLALRSIGKNKTLAQNSGINVSKITIIGLILSNGLIALGGGLFSQHQAFTDISQGVGTIIVGLAAVMIGEKLLPFRAQWCAVLACLVGSVVYRIFISFALHSEALGLESQDLNLITGVMVIMVMVTPGVRKCSL